MEEEVFMMHEFDEIQHEVEMPHKQKKNFRSSALQTWSKSSIQQKERLIGG